MVIGDVPSALVAMDRAESTVAVRLPDIRVNGRLDVATVFVSLVTAVLDADLTKVFASVVLVVATVDKLFLAAVVGAM